MSTGIYEYNEGVLTVPSVSQADLDAAVAAYDPLPDRKAQARTVAENERNRRVDLLTGPDRDKLHAMSNVLVLHQKQLAHISDPVNNPPLTPEEAGLLATMQGISGMIQAHDTAQAAIESDIDAAATVAEVEAIEAAIPTDPRWP